MDFSRQVIKTLDQYGLLGKLEEHGYYITIEYERITNKTHTPSKGYFTHKIMLNKLEEVRGTDYTVILEKRKNDLSFDEVGVNFNEHYDVFTSENDKKKHWYTSYVGFEIPIKKGEKIDAYYTRLVETLKHWLLIALS